MKILLPTDFSVTANNALSYATALSQSYNASIVVFHSYYPQINPSDVLSTPGLDLYIEQSHKKMQALIAPYQAAGLDITYKIAIGFIVDEIVQTAEALNVDLILMGNTGQGHGVASIFGSVSSETALRANCPVLLIPAKHQYHQPKVIALASNQHSLQEKFLTRVIRVAQLLKARLDFVHIDRKSDPSLEQQLKSSLPEELQKARFTYLSMENDSLIDGLNRYAASNDTDWLVMVPREKNFWQKLFSASNTKAMVGKSLQPLLVIHNRDSKTELA